MDRIFQSHCCPLFKNWLPSQSLGFHAIAKVSIDDGSKRNDEPNYLCMMLQYDLCADQMSNRLSKYCHLLSPANSELTSLNGKTLSLYSDSCSLMHIMAQQNFSYKTKLSRPGVAMRSNTDHKHVLEESWGLTRYAQTASNRSASRYCTVQLRFDVTMLNEASKNYPTSYHGYDVYCMSRISTRESLTWRLSDPHNDDAIAQDGSWMYCGTGIIILASKMACPGRKKALLSG